MLDAVMHSLPMNGGTCGKFMTMNRLEVKLAFVFKIIISNDLMI